MTRLSEWSAEEVASRLSGSGKSKSRRSGGQWEAPCPSHDDRTPSLRLTNKDGKLLWHCLAGCTSDEVRQALEGILGGEEPPPHAQRHEKEREKVEDHRRTVIPVPDTAHVGIDQFQHSTYGSPSKIWTYRLGDGSTAGWIARYDLEDGDKEVIPWVWTRHDVSGHEELVARSMPEPRPLYNLDRIQANPDAIIFFNEGEKSADAAGEMFPDWIPTTFPGGSNAFRLANLTPLHGRRVVVLPDHDGPGYDLMLKLIVSMPYETDLRMMVWPLAWPKEEGEDKARPYVLEKGDDIADHRERGWTTELVRRAVDEGHHLVHRIGDLPDPFELSHRR